MKKLFLIRHAKSSWSDLAVSDFYRTLNKRGKRDAPFMAQKLAESEASPDMILASPAKRAKKTARYMAKAVGFPKSSIVYERAIYSASVRDLFQVLAAVDNEYNELFFVGHNFAITDLAEALTGVVIDNIPTSGIVAMNCRIASWADIMPGCGEMLFFDYPKKYDQRV